MEWTWNSRTGGSHVEGDSPVVSSKCVVHYLADSKCSDFSYRYYLYKQIKWNTPQVFTVYTIQYLQAANALYGWNRPQNGQITNQPCNAN